MFKNDFYEIVKTATLSTRNFSLQVISRKMCHSAHENRLVHVFVTFRVQSLWIRKNGSCVLVHLLHRTCWKTRWSKQTRCSGLDTTKKKNTFFLYDRVSRIAQWPIIDSGRQYSLKYEGHGSRILYTYYNNVMYVMNDICIL